MLKRFFCFVLICALAVACVPALAQWRDDFADADSAQYDDALAQQLLTWSWLCNMEKYVPALAQDAGFACVGKYNYTRAADDTRHVCAYSVHQKTLPDGREAVLIVARGTGAGEWPLNLQLMPSGDYALPYAENFRLTAQAIMEEQQAYMESLSEPVFFVTGHSRGAACANVLGTLLSDRYGAQNVFCVTFATPRTVRGEYQDYDNIFNVINPEDFVTYLPLPQWGFARYGHDIILPADGADAETLQRVGARYGAQSADFASGASGTLGTYARFPDGSQSVLRFVDAMAALAPTVESTYTLRHSLLGPGPAQEGETGETAGDMMLSLFSGMMGGSTRAEQILKLSAMKANRTDFDPLLNVLFSFLIKDEMNAMISAHMPFAYSAWMLEME